MTQKNTAIADIVARQRNFFLQGDSLPIDFRIAQLKQLRRAIQSFEPAITDALSKDLHKHKVEAYTSEIGLCLDEIRFTLKHIRAWTRAKRVKGAPFFPGTKGYRIAEPYGLVLIVAPWNYPFQLVVSPLIGAIAAGNGAVCKPSECAPHTAQVVENMIAEYFPAEYISVVQGGADLSTALLQERWDYIFFTGGERVGKKVMAAAAEYLTPMTLELGGKSPCFVDADCDIKKTAKRIVWGKFLNAGQTCVAPDYVLVDRRVKEQLLAEMQRNIEKLYGQDPQRSDAFGRVINEDHVARLNRFLSEGKIVCGGRVDVDDRYVAPTLLDVSHDQGLLFSEEIFGPILPILSYATLDEAIATVVKRPKPLALYIFSRCGAYRKKIIAETSSGGVCVNDTILHLTSRDLPFGGVGASGFGEYHGKKTFDTFSHMRSVLTQTFLFDLPLRYPPFSETVYRVVKLLLK